ncbi:MAG: RDD family protein [Opitutales bacterium]|nr:RDD family protein [Opitutales bacterium]
MEKTDLENLGFPVAGIGWRTLAFLADSLLLLLLLIAVLFIGFGEQCNEFAEKLIAFQEDYRKIVALGDLERLQKFQTEILDFRQSPVCETLGNVFTYGGLALAFFYFFIGEFFFGGTSLGKRIVRIKTLSVNGEKLTAVQCGLRSFWKALTFMPTNFIVVILIIANAYVPFFNKLRRGWHDKTSGTIVVNDKYFL